MTRKLAVLAITGALLSGGLAPVGLGARTAYAQEISESHIAVAKRAMTASRSTAALDLILPRQAEAIKADLIRSRPDAEAQINAIVDEAALSVAGRRGDLENEAALIFARNFSEEELGVIADFYNSDAGKKFLNSSPLVLREIQRAAQVWTNGIRRDLGENVRAKLTEAGLQ